MFGLFLLKLYLLFFGACYLGIASVTFLVGYAMIKEEEQRLLKKQKFYPFYQQLYIILLMALLWPFISLDDYFLS